MVVVVRTTSTNRYHATQIAHPGQWEGKATVEVVICESPEEVGRLSATQIAHTMKVKGPESVMGLSTGSSTTATYEELALRVADGRLDLSQAWGFALDEYVGLPAGHPESYAEVIRTSVTEPLRMNPARVHSPEGNAADLAAAAQRYEDQIQAAGGVDVMLLGIGTNGHIGFNEPTSSFASRTRLKTLTERTRQDNSRFFDSVDEVPRQCLTQGLGTIMESREIVMVALGSGKANAIAGVVEGPITAMCPGSVLQLHPRVTIYLDPLAAEQLTLTDYYRYTYDMKPEWQLPPS